MSPTSTCVKRTSPLDFMSPEAVKESGGKGDGATFAADLWALGAMLYQLYAGATPFESQR